MCLRAGGTVALAEAVGRGVSSKRITLNITRLSPALPAYLRPLKRGVHTCAQWVMIVSPFWLRFEPLSYVELMVSPAAVCKMEGSHGCGSLSLHALSVRKSLTLREDLLGSL